MKREGIRKKGIVESTTVIRSQKRTDSSPDETEGNFRKDQLLAFYKLEADYQLRGQIQQNAINRQCFETLSIKALNDTLALVREERKRLPLSGEFVRRVSEEEDTLSTLWDYARNEMIALLLLKKPFTTLRTHGVLFTEFWKFVTVLPVAWGEWAWEYRKAMKSRPTVRDFLSSPSVPRFQVEMEGKTKEGNRDLYEQVVGTYYKLLSCLRRTLKRTYRNQDKKKMDIERTFMEVFGAGVQFPENKKAAWASLRRRLPNAEIALKAVAHHYEVSWWYVKKQVTAVRHRQQDEFYDSRAESLIKKRGGTGVSIPPPGFLFKKEHVSSLPLFHPIVIFLYEKVLSLFLHTLERRTLSQNS